MRASMRVEPSPAVPELRRVIGDGAGTPDAEVDGLDDAGLLDIHRSMVLLRTYDERSLTYHRQGRIGTYAIFWGTEAIQAGSVHALEAGRLGVPVVPRVGDRARPRDGAGDDPGVVARASGRLVGSARAQGRLDLRADRDPRAARRRPGLGPPAARRAELRGLLLRRRRDVGGRVPRGSELRRRDGRPARPPVQQQRVGDLDAARGPDPCRDPRRQGRRLRHAGRAGRRRRRPRDLRRDP